MNTLVENNNLILFLEGRIDSTSSEKAEEAIMKAISENQGKEIVIDASGLEYISSAGLRVLMKIRKRCTSPVVIREVSSEVYEIFETTGFTDLFDVHKKFKEVSVEGCEIIGRGFWGTVYRLDEDRIVKVYNCEDPVPKIRNEQKMARSAFIKGIPTAISYDIVKVGDTYGSVFELIDSKTLNDMVIEDPEGVDNILSMYVNLIREVHETEMESGVLPSARKKFLGYLNAIKEVLGNDRYEKMYALMETIPDKDTIIHGDFQMKNVMMSEGEPILIDMDTLSVGHPIFDLASLYVAYQSFLEDEPDNSLKFMGITREMSDYIWNGIFDRYFKEKDADEKAEILKKILVVAAIWFLFIVSISDGMPPELKKLRTVHTAEHLDEILKSVKNLNF